MDIRFGVVTAVLVAASVACSNPASPDIVVEPIQVDRVEVRLTASAPARAAVRVEGVVGDGCSTLHAVRQARSGNSVTVTILRQRPREAVCTQIALLYDEVIPLDGSFPPGVYSVTVNGVARTFTTD